MPPKLQQSPNSSRPVSGLSNHTSSSGPDTSDIRADIKKFLDAGDVGSANNKKKKIQKLMRKISTLLSPVGALEEDDRDRCLDAIRTHLKVKNSKVLEFLSLIEEGDFDRLRICVRSFSQLAPKDKIFDPETLRVHDPIEAEVLISRIKSATTTEPLEYPTPEHYRTMRSILTTYNTFFDQSSEQSAVIKVAAFCMLLHFPNPDLCAKYFPEFTLFSLTSKESAAEVVAHANSNDYRYFLTGRADGIIVSLTQKGDTSWSILAGKEVRERFLDACGGLTAPKYQPLASKLQRIVNQIKLHAPSNRLHLSYEIIILEVKKLQLAARIEGMELRDHLKQVIGECAAIHEYGPDQCNFVKFILSDGDHWLFGVLKNPERNVVGSGIFRECFYAILNNADLSRVEQIIRLLAVWMAIPGGMLYDSFLKTGGEAAAEGGVHK